MFSTYMSFAGTDMVKAYREQYNISLRVAPPYAHWRNSEAEKAIQICKRGARARLRAMLKAQLYGAPISDPLQYWPFSWEHTLQSDGCLASTSAEKIYGKICTKDQLYTSDFRPQQQNLHPFAEFCFCHVEKQSREGTWGLVQEPVLYLMNGQLNPLVNKY